MALLGAYLDHKMDFVEKRDFTLCHAHVTLRVPASFGRITPSRASYLLAPWGVGVYPPAKI